MVTVVIWLGTIISFASCVFVVIAGGSTRPTFLYTPLLYAFTFGALASLFGLIGAIQLDGTPATYMFSLFGLPVHEGFRVTTWTASANLLLFLAVSLYIWRPWRAIRHWSPWYPALFARGTYNESDAVLNKNAYQNALYLSWMTFTISLAILAPTLAQSAASLYLTVIGTLLAVYIHMRRGKQSAAEKPVSVTGNSLVTRTQRHNDLPLFDTLLLYVVIAVSYLAQTAPTWMAWVHLHTVELTRLEHTGLTGHAWHGPTIMVWLSLFGFIGEAGSILLMHWLTTSEQTRHVNVRIAVLFGLVSVAYLLVLRPLLMVGVFGVVVLVLDILLAATAVVVVASNYRPPFASNLTAASQDDTPGGA